MLPPKKNMKTMTIEVAQKILFAAVDVAQKMEAKNLHQIYEQAYQACGLKEEDFLPTVIKESYWFERLGRTVSPFCIIAVQNFLEAGNSVPQNFSPCAYCPYADKRLEARGAYACQTYLVSTRRFTRLAPTSLEVLDDELLIENSGQSFFDHAGEARKLIEEIFNEEISSDGTPSSSWHRSQLIVG